jgi:hypothetical protein
VKRLRHPIRAIREPFGTAGLIVAMIALVAALGGTALAAAKLNSTQKKEVEKIAKKFAGKPGAIGATGPAGSPGAAGKNGADGTNGTNGGPGTNGTNGKSVAIGATAPGCGARGGHTIEVAGESATKQNICNGEEGSPWTELGVLPEEQAETGTWGLTELGANTGFGGVSIPISFSIPLASLLDEHHVQIVAEGAEGTEGCQQGTVENPVAQPGWLCIYTSTENALEGPNFNSVDPETGENGAGRSGAILRGPVAAQHAFGFGVWIVRAPQG